MQALDFNRNKPVVCFLCEQEETRARQGVCKSCAALYLAAAQLRRQIKADAALAMAVIPSGVLEHHKGDPEAKTEVAWEDVAQAIGALDDRVHVPYMTQYGGGDPYEATMDESPAEVAEKAPRIRLGNAPRDSFRDQWEKGVTVSRQRAEAMQRILVAFQNALARAFEEGKVRGSSILRALQDGSIEAYDRQRDEAVAKFQAGEAADGRSAR